MSFKKKVVEFLVLATLAIGCGPAGAALWQWSLTPASNGISDPTINWATGNAPSAVNPSARSMMARVAEYRDDISGSLTTGGSSTAYTVTTNQAGGSVGICNGGAGPATNGQMLGITIHATNGTAPTFAPDTCAAAPIQVSSGVAVPPATLIAGTPYHLKYSTANTAWMLLGVYGGPFSVPLGAMLPYTLSTAPNSSFVLPAGQCLSTTTYATYWTLLGSPAPGACAAGQFQILDARGKVMATLDNLNGSAANLLTSSSLGCGTAMTSVGAVCANGSQSSQLQTANIPPYTPSGNVSSSGTVSINNSTGAGVIFNQYELGSGSSNNSIFSLAIASSFAGNPMGGSSQQFPNIQPTMAVGMILRVL